MTGTLAILAARSPWLLTGLLAGMGVLWIALHLRSPRAGRRAGWVWAWRVLRGGVGLAAMLLGFEAAGRWVTFTTPWPMWVLAASAAVAMELTANLYSLERRAMSRPVGWAVTIVRLVLVVAVVGVLAQPVRIRRHQQTVRRTVAILVDESASMRVADDALSPAERIRLAEMLGVRAARRPVHLDETAARLTVAARTIADVADWLEEVASLRQSAAVQVARQGATTHGDRLAEAQAVLIAQREQLDAAGRDGGTPPQAGVQRKQLRQVRSGLASFVEVRLAEARELLDESAPARLAEAAGRTSRRLTAAVSKLAEFSDRLNGLADAVDAGWYAGLSDVDRETVDRATNLPRLVLARQTLRDGLLSRADDQHQLRLYRFAGGCAAITRKDLLAPAQPVSADTETEALATDLAGALDRVLADIPAENLAGVVLVTDGRQTAVASIDRAVARLARGRVPVSTVLMGAGRGPRDAGLVRVDAPEKVLPGDAVDVRADLKLDGLAGQTVAVALVCDGRQVARQDVKVRSQAERRTVQLSHVPEAGPVAAYEVTVECDGPEAFTANNRRPVRVRVQPGKTRVLLVEDRPRWEFRYLKNLFADRDRTVSLQYVLLNGDRVAGQSKPRAVAASPTRPPGHVQATHLPAGRDAWLGFDVVILGDVGPAQLGADAMADIATFVTDRGGTLVVQAGRWHMPAAFEGTPLAALLPVEPGSSTGSLQTGGEGFHFRPTQAGTASIICRLAETDARIADAFAAIPPLYWRHGHKAVRPGSTVLAYALALDAPQELTAAPADEKALVRQRQYQGDQALLVSRHVGLGRVLYVGTDRTWRMRYRVGDPVHHRFWGQVLRWATAQKLQAGTEHVKLGTDAVRYDLGQDVTVRARLTDRQFKPIRADSLGMELFRDGQGVRRHELAPLAGSTGLYSVRLSDLPAGVYRVRLTGPQVQQALAAEPVDAVSTEFSVSAPIPAELVEVARDGSLPGKLAEGTGGVVVPAHRAGEVVDTFGEARLRRRRVDQRNLWDDWIVLAGLLGLLSAEWMLRKKAGLP